MEHRRTGGKGIPRFVRACPAASDVKSGQAAAGGAEARPDHGRMRIGFVEEFMGTGKTPHWQRGSMSQSCRVSVA
jgi:hypothetical protein